VSPPLERTARILVVEDEEAIATGLIFNLRRKGYQVDHEADGKNAFERARAGGYDLLVLDVQLPRMDGFQICQQLRHAGVLSAILMLTARDQPDDKVFGLKTGADDYLVKPFDLGELLARVEGLLRRIEWGKSGSAQEAAAAPPAAGPASAAPPLPGGAEAEDRLHFGPYWVDFKTWQAKTREGLVELSRKELSVLKIFAERPNEVITRRELLEQVWELPNHPNTRVVDNVIVALRKSFEEDAWRPRHIHSVRGAGYRFTP
jgi:two-component system, OmpR family, alkaline phosphatase synthesis response regulator PhoP